jgi:ketosteroid isomerase-like protein
MRRVCHLSNSLRGCVQKKNGIRGMPFSTTVKDEPKIVPKNNLEEITLLYLRTMENRRSPEEVMLFYHRNIQQIEFPNAITKETTARNFDDIVTAAAKGSKVLSKEEYKVCRLYSVENTVIVEVFWTGTLAIPLGSIPVGGKMTAHFAQFIEFLDGKIIRQRNYDCFDPFL